MVGDDRVDMACGRAAGAGGWEEGEGKRGGGRGDEGRMETEEVAREIWLVMK